MAKEKKELAWGETPFHHMTHEELLKAAIKMYDACVSARSALKLSSFRQEYSPFWNEGTGGCALEKCNQVVEPMEKEYSSENIYRSFYRPGIDLLWEDKGRIKLNTNWALCSVCDAMVSSDGSDYGKRCGDVVPFSNGKCNGILRPITWEDMRPQNQ